MSSKAPELTPEQQKALVDAMAQVTEVVGNIMGGITEAIMPIIKAYNDLPPALKEAMAEAQVKPTPGSVAADTAANHHKHRRKDQRPEPRSH